MQRMKGFGKGFPVTFSKTRWVIHIPIAGVRNQDCSHRTCPDWDPDAGISCFWDKQHVPDDTCPKGKRHEIFHEKIIAEEAKPKEKKQTLDEMIFTP